MINPILIGFTETYVIANVSAKPFLIKPSENSRKMRKILLEILNTKRKASKVEDITQKLLIRNSDKKDYITVFY